VDSQVSVEAIERLYAAPEVNGIFQLTPAADWWSFGAIIFELLTGKVCNRKYNIQLGIDISIDSLIQVYSLKPDVISCVNMELVSNIFETSLP
jgi:serine/threonine protein kinase